MDCACLYFYEVFVFSLLAGEVVACFGAHGFVVVVFIGCMLGIDVVGSVY